MSAEITVAGVEDEAPEAVASGRRFCFVAGTHVCTLRGDMAVEQLRAGDHIRAKKGSFHTVTEVQVVAFEDLDPEAQAAVGLYPIKRGAFEEGLPKRDFYVSAGQQFELSRRLEIAHAVRMAVRKEGAGLRGLRFVLFACPGLPMIRAEGIWTTLTPIEIHFPMAAPEAVAEPVEGTQDAPPPVSAPPVVRRPEVGRMASRVIPPLVAGPEPVEVPQEAAAPIPVPQAAVRRNAGRTVTRFLRSPLSDAAPAEAAPPQDPAPPATRRPVTRFVRVPASEPALHHTETGTPAP